MGTTSPAGLVDSETPDGALGGMVPDSKEGKEEEYQDGEHGKLVLHVGGHLAAAKAAWTR